MARFNFKTDDIIGEFLPDITIKRITVEDYLEDLTHINQNQVFVDQGQMTLEIDLEVSDVLDREVAKVAQAAVRDFQSLVESDHLSDRLLGRELMGKYEGQSEKDIIDSALKVCVLVSLDGRTDEAIKRLLTKYAGQRENFRDRYASFTGADGFPEGFHPSMKDVLQRASRAGTSELEGVEVGTLRYFEAPARSLNGEQYTEQAYELLAQRGPDNKVIYKLPHTFSVVLAGRENISVFAFTYMDFDIFDMSLDGMDRSFLNCLYGKVSYNQVLVAGKVKSTSMILVDHQGTQYVGPYHKMAMGRSEEDYVGAQAMAAASRHGAYMKGRFHDPTRTDATQYLTPIMVPNYKIQDFRSFSRAEKDNFLPAQFPSFLQQDLNIGLEEKKANKVNARLDVTQNTETGVVSMEILIDQEQLLLSNSKFSPVIESAGLHFSNLSGRRVMLLPRRSFRLVRLAVIRRRVTRRNVGIDRFGFGAPDEFDREQPYHIVAETGEPSAPPYAGFEEVENNFSQADLLTPVLTTDAELSDDTVENLQRAMSPGFAYRNFLLRNREGKAPIEADAIPFPFYRNIIVKDKSLTNVLEGVYQYGIELVYEDPIEKYLKGVLQELRLRTRQLQEYYNEASIPLFSAKFAMRTSEDYDPEIHGEISDEYREQVERFNELFGLEGTPESLPFSRNIPPERGSYNYVRKKFTQSFVERANAKYDFTAIQRAYTDAFRCTIVDKSLRVSNIPLNARRQEHLDTQALGGWDATVNVSGLIRPNNSRPEQILSVLRSMMELEGLLGDMLDVDLIKDIRSVQLTPAQAGSSGRAPHLIRVKHWFSAGRGAYVDARNRTRVQMEVLEEEEENLPVAPPAQEEEVEAEILEEEENQESPLRIARRKALEYLRQVENESKNPAVITEVRKFRETILSDPRIDDARTLDHLLNEFKLHLANVAAGSK